MRYKKTTFTPEAVKTMTFEDLKQYEKYGYDLNDMAKTLGIKKESKSTAKKKPEITD